MGSALTYIIMIFFIIFIFGTAIYLICKQVKENKGKKKNIKEETKGNNEIKH